MTRNVTRPVIAATAVALVLGGALAASRQHADDAQLLSKLSSSRLTLVDGMSLADVIAKAEGQQPGTVYSAIAAIQGGRPVVDVLVATRDGQSKHVIIELK